MQKKVFQLLVDNNPGVLSRISGLFSRRGYSIESITAGVTSDYKVTRITIVAVGDDVVLEQIEKQLGKLVDLIGRGVTRCDNDAVGLFVESLPILHIRGKTVNGVKGGSRVRVHVARLASEFTAEIHSDERRGFTFVNGKGDLHDLSSLSAQLLRKNRRLRRFAGAVKSFNHN